MFLTHFTGAPLCWAGGWWDLEAAELPGASGLLPECC